MLSDGVVLTAWHLLFDEGKRRDVYNKNDRRTLKGIEN